MSKLYLCYSSIDKEYVQIVARHLRRANIIFDELNFEPGGDFRAEIDEGLGTASHFIFIASKNSLNSMWCKYELSEAEMLKMKGKLSCTLTIIVDDSTTEKDLPKWMQNSKAVFEKKPSQAIRDIKEMLATSVTSCAIKPFVGRQDLQQAFVDSISNWNSIPKKIIMLTGLEGVGRRSYLERSAKDTLDLSLGPYFIVNETDGIEDIYIWLCDETYDLNMKNSRIQELEAFSKLNEEEQITEISNRLHILCKDNCMPCFIDAGGMLDEAARLHDRYKLLMQTFLSQELDNYIAFIFYRAPQIRELDFYDNILYQKVGPLNPNESKLLLKLLFKRSGVDVKTENIDEIVEYIDGYPPCVYYTVWYSQLYGVENILNDKSYLEDFKAKRFIRYIKNLNLSDKQWFLLQYLANEDFVPISLLTLILDIRQEETSALLCSLIDNNLVRVLDSNYGIYSPIKSAVIRINGVLGTKVYNEIKDKLVAAFWTGDNPRLSLEIIDATLHALARSGSRDFDPCNDVVRISTIHSLAIEYYRNREWKIAIEYSKRALSMDYTRHDIRAILYKSLVQSERWEEAESELKIIEESGNWNFPYLKGFMLKKKSKYTEAIKYFEISLHSGNRGYNVYRDYGECLHKCGRNKEALRVVKKVLKSDSENIYVLDLITRICIDGQMYDLVEKYLSILEKYDFEKRFLYHRKSSYFAAKEMYNAALTQAEAACKTKFASFEAHALKADIYMKLKQCHKAEEVLAEMKEKFGNTKKDIQLGLNCKLLLCTDNWQQAKRVWDSIDDKT